MSDWYEDSDGTPFKITIGQVDSENPSPQAIEIPLYSFNPSNALSPFNTSYKTEESDGKSQDQQPLKPTPTKPASHASHANPAKPVTPIEMIHSIVLDMLSNPGLIRNTGTIRETISEQCQEDNPREIHFGFKGATFSIGRRKELVWLSHWKPGITPSMLQDPNQGKLVIADKSNYVCYSSLRINCPESLTLALENLIITVRAVHTGTWDELKSLSGNAPSVTESEKMADSIAERMVP
jgi:hypothetical protein